MVGGNASTIDGAIAISGSNANFFLLNPAGIVFGPNATLNVPGAFTATTANGIGFDDGGWFSGTTNKYQTLIGDPNTFAKTHLTAGKHCKFRESHRCQGAIS